jgi:hypothetical protein
MGNHFNAMGNKRRNEEVSEKNEEVCYGESKKDEEPSLL